MLGGRRGKREEEGGREVNEGGGKYEKAPAWILEKRGEQTIFIDMRQVNAAKDKRRVKERKEGSGGVEIKAEERGAGNTEDGHKGRQDKDRTNRCGLECIVRMMEEEMEVVEAWMLKYIKKVRDSRVWDARSRKEQGGGGSSRKTRQGTETRRKGTPTWHSTKTKEDPIDAANVTNKTNIATWPI